jgi:hypothetical protein
LEAHLPCFIHSLSVCLSAAARQAELARKLHCLNWLGLALLLEVSQHSIFATPLASWLVDTLSMSTWEIISALDLIYSHWLLSMTLISQKVQVSTLS